MSRRNDSRTNRTAGHPATRNPVSSMRATVAAFGLTVAVLLTMVAPTAMVAAAFTVGLVYLAIARVRPRLAGPGIPLPGTRATLQISSKRDSEREPFEYTVTVAVVEESS